MVRYCHVKPKQHINTSIILTHPALPVWLPRHGASIRRLLRLAPVPLQKLRWAILLVPHPPSLILRPGRRLSFPTFSSPPPSATAHQMSDPDRPAALPHHLASTAGRTTTTVGPPPPNSSSRSGGYWSPENPKSKPASAVSITTLFACDLTGGRSTPSLPLACSPQASTSATMA